MVLLTIIPIFYGYLFGNIPYFQTNPFGSFQTQNWIDFCLNSGTHLRGFIEHIFLRARHKRHQVVEEKVHVDRVWGPGICLWISHCDVVILVGTDRI